MVLLNFGAYIVSTFISLLLLRRYSFLLTSIIIDLYNESDFGVIELLYGLLNLTLYPAAANIDAIPLIIPSSGFDQSSLKPIQISISFATSLLKEWQSIRSVVSVSSFDIESRNFFLRANTSSYLFLSRHSR